MADLADTIKTLRDVLSSISVEDEATRKKLGELETRLAELEDLSGQTNISVGDISGKAIAIGRDIEVFVDEHNYSGFADQQYADLLERLNALQQENEDRTRIRRRIAMGAGLGVATVGIALGVFFFGGTQQARSLIDQPVGVQVSEEGCDVENVEALIEGAGGRVTEDRESLQIEARCVDRMASVQVHFPPTPAHHIDFLPVIETMEFEVPTRDLERTIEALVLYRAGRYADALIQVDSLRSDQPDVQLLHGMITIYLAASDIGGAVSWFDARSVLAESDNGAGSALTGLTYIYEYQQAVSLGSDALVDETWDACVANAGEAFQNSIELEPDRNLWKIYPGVREFSCPPGPYPDVDVIVAIADEVDGDSDSLVTDRATMLSYQSLVESVHRNDPNPVNGLELAEEALDLGTGLPLPYRARACALHFLNQLPDAASTYRSYRRLVYGDWRLRDTQVNLRTSALCS